MGQKFLSTRKWNGFGALVQVVIENPYGGTSTLKKR
jgi:hypothetical protein